MATTQKTNRAVERLAETTRDSYQTVVDHAVGLQAESNRSVMGELFERAEDQRDAYQTLVEQSIDAYMDLAYAPFTYYKEGLEAARKTTR
jgi:hypothetical protein